MVKGKIILAITNVWWNYRRGFPQHFMEPFTRYNTVIFIGAVPIVRFIALFLRQRQEIVSRKNNNLFTYIVPALPYVARIFPESVLRYSAPFIIRVNCWIIIIIARFILRINRMKVNMLWFCEPIYSRLIASFKENVSVYHCYDDSPNFPSNKKIRKAMVDAERYALENVDQVFATSQKLFNDRSSFNISIRLITNAADIKQCARALDPDVEIPQELRYLPTPIIGVIAGLDFRLDIKLLEYLAAMSPHWSIVMIGPVMDKNVLRLKRFLNIHFLGEKPFLSIPCFLKGIDVALIPFVLTEVTKSMSTMKLYEYLSAGKPVVSTPLPESMRFKDVIYIAATPEEFLVKIRRAMSENSQEAVNRRILAVQNESWENRVEHFSEVIKPILDGNSA